MKKRAGKKEKLFSADIINIVRYRDKGQMATIGRKKAIAELGGLRISGLFAWLAWLFVHIFYLIGFRNRVLVLFNWTWSYFRYSRGARLIVGKEWRSHRL